MIKGSFLQTKWMKAVLWLIAAALFTEVIICNFSAWNSLLFRERIVFEDIVVEGGEEISAGSGEYVVPEGSLQLRLQEINTPVHNLFFAVDFSENDPVSYTVSITDEGNAYPYELPEGTIVPGLEKSRYTNLYPAGAVRRIDIQLTVPIGSVVTVNGICANAKIPFEFHIGRFFVIATGLLLIYFAGNKTVAENFCEKKKWQVGVIAVVVLFLILLSWKLAHVNPICIASPWPHHKQYQELAEAMAKGQLYLDIQPSEALLAVDNPYDTIYLQANGIDYRADYAFYEGRYYVYFGVVPELLLYLPCYLLTGHHLPNYMAVFLFYSGFILAVFALLFEVQKRWFQKIPLFAYLLLASVTVCGGNYLFVIARPDLYDTPIMAATMFTVAGLWLWIKGKYADTEKKKVLFLLAGSLCMALVAGCRPQMVLFSALAVPLFWEEVIKKRELFSKKSLWQTVCICLPYVLVAAGLMLYNAARFSSPLDFGATYSLTSNDMTKRSFNLPQMLLGIWHYFLRPPVWESDFPFLQGIQVASASYMGKLNSEYTYGGILAANIFTWVLLFLGKAGKSLKKKKLFSFVLVNIMISLVIGVADVTGAGILQRYMVDMIWGIWFAALLVMLVLLEESRDTNTYQMIMRLLAVIALVQLFYGFGIVFGNGDLSVNVKTANPELYYEIKSLFMF